MKNPELAVIMPVYNEEGVIENVIRKWMNEFQQLGISCIFHVYNDGSKDNTKNILEKVALKHDNLVVHNKENSGHGPTILKGYVETTDSDWLFQIDSDDEISCDSFIHLWNNRLNHDLLIGNRINRNSPLIRRFITYISKLVIYFFYGKGITDVNCPFRLMRSETFKNYYKIIPPSTFAPNILITGIACFKKFRVFQINVNYNKRTTGEVSIKRFKLLKSAIKSYIQTIRFKRILTKYEMEN